MTLFRTKARLSRQQWHAKNIGRVQVGQLSITLLERLILQTRSAPYADKIFCPLAHGILEASRWSYAREDEVSISH